MLSPHSPSHNRRSDHLPCLAEATVGPEDVVFVLVATPVLVGSGASTFTVLCEGGEGLDLVKKKCCLKDSQSLPFYCFL